MSHEHLKYVRAIRIHSHSLNFFKNILTFHENPQLNSALHANEKKLNFP